MIAKIHGEKARFCGEMCKEGFKADREGGMCYGLHKVNGVICMHREEYSLVTQRCAYCGEAVKDNQPVPKHLKEKFNIADEETRTPCSPS